MGRKKKKFQGSDVEYEQESNHVLTRGKLILIIIGLILLIFLIIFIASKIKVTNKKKEEKYLTSDFIKLEERMNEEAPIYLSQKNINVDDTYKVNLNDLLLENGGSIDSNKTKAAKICTGYVLVTNEEELLRYKPYISCGKYYKTKGYINDVTTTVKKTTIKDIEKPVITLKGDKDITININEEYKEPGFIANDNIDGDITSNVKISGDVNSRVAATYTLTYEVSDKAGNKTSETRKVNVINVTTTTIRTNNNTTKKVTTNKTTRVTTPPKIILNESNVSIIQGSAYNIYSGYRAYDAKGIDITSKVKISGSVNTSYPGVYYVTYSVTDSYGNKASAVKTINVTAKTSAYIKLKSISLSNDSLSMKSGATQKIYIVSFYPINATNQSVTWKSSNSSVISIISTNGTEAVIKANKPGREIITVYGADGITKTCLVIAQ